MIFQFFLFFLILLITAAIIIIILFFFIIFFLFLFNLSYDLLDFTQSSCLLNDKFILKSLFSYSFSFFLLFYIHLSLSLLIHQTYLIQLVCSSDVAHHFCSHFAVLNHHLCYLSHIE